MRRGGGAPEPGVEEGEEEEEEEENGGVGALPGGLDRESFARAGGPEPRAALPRDPRGGGSPRRAPRRQLRGVRAEVREQQPRRVGAPAPRETAAAAPRHLKYDTTNTGARPGVARAFGGMRVLRGARGVGGVSGEHARAGWGLVLAWAGRTGGVRGRGWRTFGWRADRISKG